MKLYKKNSDSLIEVKNNEFRLEKDIQSLIEKNTEELFGLKFISSEFSIGEYRIDSLCYDNENNSFVIIEYKKTSSYSVIDQGYSYLSTMLNNKSDFILEYNESTNETLKRNDIDWGESRIIFISPSFNSYQKNSVNFKDIPFELFEIKKYTNDIISLNEVSSNSSESIKTISKGKNKTIEKVSKEIKVYTEEDFLNYIPDELEESYFSLKNKIINLGEIKVGCKKNYINFWVNNEVIVYINKGKRFLSVHIISPLKNPFQLDDPRGLFKLWEEKQIYYHDLTLDSDLDYIFMVVKQKYHQIIGN